MEFILVIFLSYHIDGGVHSQKIEFKSKSSCIAAKAQMEKDFKNTKRGAGWRYMTASCLAK